MLEGDFKTFCLGDAAFSAAVAARFYPVLAPQKVVAPYGVYKMVSDVPIGDHDSAGAELSRSRYQVDLYGKSAAEAGVARDALKARANGFAGTVGTTDFQEIWSENASGGYDTDLKLYRYSCDFMITYQAAP